MEIRLIQVKEPESAVHLTSSDAIYEMFGEEKSADRECLWVLHLNTQNQVIEKELVSMGTLNASCAHPREVFKKAILNSAASIITVHNHPSGSTGPSLNDFKLWKRLIEAGRIIGIEVLDNLTISQTSYYSDRRERGTLYEAQEVN
ncbi:MAG: JAB domain-containing protein [Chloroflexi bacterium]|nr:JAB domain-containing protein [Chloroflexota bacterium]